mgnify:CR=1 FL=1
MRPDPISEAALDAIMRIMHAAFDPQWGEAWTRNQVSSALMLSNTHATLIAAGGEDMLDPAEAEGFAIVRAAPSLAVTVAHETRMDSPVGEHLRSMLEKPDFHVSDATLNECARALLDACSRAAVAEVVASSGHRGATAARRALDADLAAKGTENSKAAIAHKRWYSAEDVASTAQTMRATLGQHPHLGGGFDDGAPPPEEVAALVGADGVPFSPFARDYRGLRRARELLESGAIGDVIAVHSDFGWPADPTGEHERVLGGGHWRAALVRLAERLGRVLLRVVRAVVLRAPLEHL